MNEYPRINILSAAFARSNMGHSLSPQIAQMKEPDSLYGAVLRVCADLIESDEHSDLFLEEATAWKDLLQTSEGLARYRSYSPHVFAAVEGQS